MGRKINPLSNPQESLAKKTAIEEILNHAKVIANTNAASWLPQRRYLQKVLWSLSITELNKWTIVDTEAILSKLRDKDPKSKQIAYLEEIVKAQGIALVTVSHDNSYLEKSERAIAEGRRLGR